MKNKDLENSHDEIKTKSKESEGSSSSESLLEIKPNEFVKRSELTAFDVRAIVVRCSSCGRQINHNSSKDLRKHRKLGVVTCKECYEFYGSSEFSQDDSGYNYCTWCGNGGKLIVCDYCPNGFCDSCIRRNFGRAEISITTQEGWRCYCCNKKRLKSKVKFCDFIIESKEKHSKKEKKTVSHATKNISEGWLQTAFDESDKACKKFHHKMAKLKVIGVNKSKSLKHIVKKMEDIIKNHKTDLKSVIISMTEQYGNYIKQLEEKKADSDDCVVIEQEKVSNDPSVDELSDVSVSILATPDKSNKQEDTKSQDDANNLDEKKIQAKMSLLKSSSESEDDNKEEPVLMDTDSQNNELTDDKTKNLSKSKLNETSNKKDKCKLNFDFSNSSDSDFHIDKSNIDKLIEDSSEKEDSNEMDIKKSDEKQNMQIDSEVDPKLTQESYVHLIRCDHLLKDDKTTLRIGNDNDVETELDKLVDSLCKFPLNRKKRVQRSKLNYGPLSARKAAAKKQLMESSSSIDSLSSDEDEDQKKIQLDMKCVNKKADVLPKGKEQSDSDSSMDILASDSDEEENKKKTSKKSKASKKADSESSDDFVTSKKKRKFDKLLHGALLSDDEKKTKEKKQGPARKRKVLSSDEEKKISNEKKNSNKSSSSTSSSDEDTKKKKQTKKRRRIKKLGSSSEEGASDNDNPDNTPGKGRKNIRKIESKKKLAETTKEAQLEEKERRKRISERQKLYNKIEDMSVDGKEVITRKMVLEVDQDSKAEVVEIHPDLVCKLKPHQVNGVKFMWECTIESVKDLDQPGSGCILAHCMGLGKTLQVIAFLHTCLTNPVVSKKITRAMIICPYNTALNWASEFEHWLEDVDGDVQVHQLTNIKTNFERMDILKFWFVEGGVLIISYDIFRRLSAEKIARLKIKERNQIKKHLLDPGPDIVVCDEGHILKNDKSAISLATNKLTTRRRIVLTGTPLQNNLAEYHCMLSFVKPNLLGTAKEFRNRFVNPIINGQYDDSNLHDVKLMKKRIHILHKLLEGCVQRCDYSALTKFLPTKHEFVISVKLSDIQIKMYQCYLDRRLSAQQDMKAVGKSLFIDFNNLRCIWTHPYIIHVSAQRQEYKKLFKEDDEEFVNDDSATSSSESKSGGSTSDDDKLIEKIKTDNKKKDYRTRSKANENSESETEEVPESDKRWYDEFVSEKDQYNIELSGKMVLLMEILKECETIGDKIIVFSQSLLCLDCIEDMLEHCSSQPASDEDKNRDASGIWTKGLDYFRMDGATSVDLRKNYIDMFNNPKYERARLFLISTRAGSLGTNLVGANRVVIMDTSWNPSHDVQAIFRVYRFGQIKPVYIYRLLAQGTMEEKIYDRQVTKLSLSCRVVDEQQIERHFSAADLAELYMFDPNATTNRPTPMLPKDRLLAEMLIKNNNWIVTFHEHDSLLQNQTEEDLTEEERQAAWTEYENEREGRTPSVPGVNIEELNNLTKEPDFQQDYEGKVIPDLKMIVESIFEHLKAEVKDPPTSIMFKERLRNAVLNYRQLLMEKHVKHLRTKQEYISQGQPCPNSLNKYLEELTSALRSTSEYVMKLNEVIQRDSKQQMPQQQQQQRVFFSGKNAHKHKLFPRSICLWKCSVPVCSQGYTYS